MTLAKSTHFCVLQGRRSVASRLVYQREAASAVILFKLIYSCFHSDHLIKIELSRCRNRGKGPPFLVVRWLSIDIMILLQAVGGQLGDADDPMDLLNPATSRAMHRTAAGQAPPEEGPDFPTEGGKFIIREEETAGRSGTI